MRLGHRVSVDFDLFTEKSLKREELEEAFPSLGRSTVLQDERILFPLAGVKLPLNPAGFESSHLQNRARKVRLDSLAPGIEVDGT